MTPLMELLEGRFIAFSLDIDRTVRLVPREANDPHAFSLARRRITEKDALNASINMYLKMPFHDFTLSLQHLRIWAIWI